MRRDSVSGRRTALRGRGRPLAGQLRELAWCPESSRAVLNLPATSQRSRLAATSARRALELAAAVFPTPEKRSSGQFYQTKVVPDAGPLERRVACGSRETDTEGQKSAQLTELRISPTYPGVEVSRGVDTGRTFGTAFGGNTDSNDLEV